MLELEVPAGELYDEVNECFIETKPVILRLEHSLVSISKWETKWRKPFLVKTPPKTREESLDYIRCMTLNQNIDPMLYESLRPNELRKINEYIEANLSATTFSNAQKARPNNQVMTSEMYYYYMVAYRIPFECQKWHLSRLTALIRICDIKNNPGNKMSRREVLNQNRALNEARRKAKHTKG